MKDVLTHILTSIVDTPEKLSVEEEVLEDGVVNFNVSVAKNEMGKVIGKEGKVIRAIRNVMKIKAIKENKKITITLTEYPEE